MAKNMKVSDALFKTAELLDKGWCKGTMWRQTRSGNDQYCMIGGLQEACGGTGVTYDNAKAYVTDILGCGEIGTFTAITAFNDAKERTKTEAIDVLLHAAAYAKSEGN